MAEILEYKCPCCGGAIRFDSSIQKMKCPYCDTEFDLDTLREFEEEYIEQDRNPAWHEDTVDQSEETLGSDTQGDLVSYQCENCGGEIVADRTMAASSCPYCGNPVIVMKQLSGMLRPDVVIPFKLDQKTAEDNLRNHLRGKVLLPKLFKSENRIKEIKGVYVPFWLYDCKANADITCRATRTRIWRERDYECRETSHFLVKRSGSIGFEGVPVDGSTRMDDALMQSIEPFQYEDAVPFQTAYLAGYLADRYDQNAQECAPVANERMRQSTVNSFMSTIVGYETCVPEHTDIRLQNGKITYALLPVWILNTMYKGKRYTFAMNGQTGRFVGNLPVDRGRALRLFAGTVAVGMLLSWLVTMML
jgi:DNA-directed RNA polymerase subunit RPC12/RpoP